MHRLEPMRKLLLYEKQAQKSADGSSLAPLSRETTFMFPGPSSGIGVAGARAPPPTRTGSVGGNSITGVIGTSIAGPSRSGANRQQPPRDDPAMFSLLGNLEGGDSSGLSTEFEVNVQLPGCQIARTPLDPKNKASPMVPVRFHHSTIWENIVVHHWIKIVLRISKVDENSENKTKRRHFEISIDSPIHLLSVSLSLISRFRVLIGSVVLKEIHIFLLMEVQVLLLSQEQI